MIGRLKVDTMLRVRVVCEHHRRNGDKIKKIQIPNMNDSARARVRDAAKTLPVLRSAALESGVRERRGETGKEGTKVGPSPAGRSVKTDAAVLRQRERERETRRGARVIKPKSV